MPPIHPSWLFSNMWCRGREGSGKLNFFRPLFFSVLGGVCQWLSPHWKHIHAQPYWLRMCLGESGERADSWTVIHLTPFEGCMDTLRWEYPLKTVRSPRLAFVWPGKHCIQIIRNTYQWRKLLFVHSPHSAFPGTSSLSKCLSHYFIWCKLPLLW